MARYNRARCVSMSWVPIYPHSDGRTSRWGYRVLPERAMRFPCRDVLPSYPSRTPPHPLRKRIRTPWRGSFWNYCWENEWDRKTKRFCPKPRDMGWLLPSKPYCPKHFIRRRSNVASIRKPCCENCQKLVSRPIVQRQHLPTTQSQRLSHNRPSPSLPKWPQHRNYPYSDNEGSPARKNKRA